MTVHITTGSKIEEKERTRTRRMMVVVVAHGGSMLAVSSTFLFGSSNKATTVH